jgi:hypothetical protein
MTEDSLRALALSCAQAPVIDALPVAVDVRHEPPANPPQELQEKFVGMSFESAYLEAYSFVSVVDEKLVKYGLPGLESAARIVDFGSGWGRISRLLLGKLTPTSLYALDVDPEMTTLVNRTLPGINAMTVSSFPPSALAESGFDGVLAFSVFSHLSEEAHTAWAREFGRLVRPGGFAAVTVLDASLFDAVRSAQGEVADGSPSPFAVNMSTTFPDVAAATRSFRDGQFQFAQVGADGARDSQHYGWAAAPIPFLERTWGEAGFRILDYVPAHVLFPQSLVVMERLTQPGPSAGDGQTATAADYPRHSTGSMPRRSLVDRLRRRVGSALRRRPAV